MADRYFGADDGLDEEAALSSATESSEDEAAPNRDETISSKSKESAQSGIPEMEAKNNVVKQRKSKGKVGFLFGNVDRKLVLERGEYLDEEEGAREHIDRLRGTLTQHTDAGGVVRETTSELLEKTSQSHGDGIRGALIDREAVVDYGDQEEMLVDEYDKEDGDDGDLALPSHSTIAVHEIDEGMKHPTFSRKDDSLKIEPTMMPALRDRYTFKREMGEDYDDDAQDEDSVRLTGNREQDFTTRENKTKLMGKETLGGRSMSDDDGDHLKVLYIHKDGRQILKFTEFFLPSSTMTKSKKKEKAIVLSKKKFDSPHVLPLIESVDVLNEEDELLKSSVTQRGIFTWPNDMFRQLPRSYFEDCMSVFGVEGEERLESRSLSGEFLNDINGCDRPMSSFTASSTGSQQPRYLVEINSTCQGMQDWENCIDWTGSTSEGTSHTENSDCSKFLQNLSKITKDCGNNKVEEFDKTIKKNGDKYVSESFLNLLVVGTSLQDNVPSAKKLVPKESMEHWGSNKKSLKSPMQRLTSANRKDEGYAKNASNNQRSVRIHTRKSDTCIKFCEVSKASASRILEGDEKRVVNSRKIEEPMPSFFRNESSVPTMKDDGEFSHLTQNSEDRIDAGAPSTVRAMDLLWRNEELERGDWMGAVMWDNNYDSMALHKAKSLILDLNDANMIFEFNADGIISGMKSLPDLYNIYDDLKRNSASFLLKNRTVSVAYGKQRSSRRAHEVSWEFDAMRKISQSVKASVKKQEPGISTAKRETAGPLQVRRISSHAIPAIVFSTTKNFLDKGDRDSWHKPLVISNISFGFLPLRVSKQAITAGDKKAVALRLGAKKGITRLRIRSLSKFSPVPITTKEGTPFLLRAENLTTLIERWLENNFPKNMRDIHSNDIQNGSVILKILKASKTKKEHPTGEGSREQRLNIVEVPACDKRALSEIRTCTEHNIICIDRPKVTPMPTSKLLTSARLKSESMMVAHEELSASSGGYVYLCEYLEEEPYYMAIPGMRLQLCTYYRKRSEKDTPPSFTEAQNFNQFQPCVNLLNEGLLGKTILLEPDNKSPFAPLADIGKGQYIGAVRCEMFVAPAVKHAVRDSDFLLLRSATGKWRVREIQGSVAVGQQLPRKGAIFEPNKREMNEFNERRLKVFVYREIQAKKFDADMAEKRVHILEQDFKSAAKHRNYVKKHRDSEIAVESAQLKLQAAEESLNTAKELIEDRECIARNLKDFAEIFPNQKPELLRKRLKNCGLVFKGTDVRHEEGWVLGDGFVLPAELVIRKLLSCEEICIYESMAVNRDRLRKHGLNRLLILPKSTSERKQEDFIMNIVAGSPRLKSGVREIKELLHRVPWKLTHNFFDACQGSIQLSILGNADPSGRGLCFSFKTFASTKSPKARRGVRCAPLEEYRAKCMSVWKNMLGVLEAKDPRHDEIEDERHSGSANEKEAPSDDDFLDDLMDEDDASDDDNGATANDQGDLAQARAAFEEALTEERDKSMKEADPLGAEENPDDEKPSIRRLRCVVHRKLDDGSISEEVSYVYDGVMIERLLELKRGWNTISGTRKALKAEVGDEIQIQAQHREHRKYLEQQRRERKRKALGLPEPGTSEKPRKRGRAKKAKVEGGDFDFDSPGSSKFRDPGSSTVKKGKRGRKKKKNIEDSDDFSDDYSDDGTEFLTESRKSSSRKRGVNRVLQSSFKIPSNDPLVINNVLHEVLTTVMYPDGPSKTNVRGYAAFHDKVKPKVAPDYYDIVDKKDHVYLRYVLIKTKSSQNYKDVEEFKRDIGKIVANAKAYNGTNPTTGKPYGMFGHSDLADAAQEMAAKIYSLVDEKIARLREAEQEGAPSEDAEPTFVS